MVSLYAGSSRGLTLDGLVVRSLPRSALSALQTEGSGDRARPFVSELRSEATTDYVLDGAGRVGVAVRRVARAR